MPCPRTTEPSVHSPHMNWLALNKIPTSRSCYYFPHGAMNMRHGPRNTIHTSPRDAGVLTWGHQGSEKASELPKVTQLVNVTALSLLGCRGHIPSQGFSNFYVYPNHLGSLSSADLFSRSIWCLRFWIASKLPDDVHEETTGWIWRLRRLYYIVPFPK